MNIVSKQELGLQPSGTVFMLYDPDFTDGQIHIKTDSGGIDYQKAPCNRVYWNGEMKLTPFWKTVDDSSERFCNWSTIDTSSHDYNDNQKFIIFSKTEVHQMINALMWALSGCETYFNEDVWIYGNTVLSEDDFNLKE